MMDCLHLSFVTCPPGGVHLNKVNLRIGHLRTEMEQLCDELDEDDGAAPQPESISRIQDTTPTTTTTAIRTLSVENSTHSAAKEEPSTTTRQQHPAPTPSSAYVVSVPATAASLTPSATSALSTALGVSSSSNVTPLTSSSSHSSPVVVFVSHGHDKCNDTEDGDADYDLAGPLGDGDKSPSPRVTTAATALFDNDNFPNRRRLYYSDGGGGGGTSSGSSSSNSIAEQTPPSEFLTILSSLDHPRSSTTTTATSRRADSSAAASEGKSSEKALQECHPGTTCSVTSSVVGIAMCSWPIAPFIAISALFLYQLLK